MSGPIIGMLIFATHLFLQVFNLIQGDEFMGLPAWTRSFWTAFDLFMLVGFYGSYMRTIAKRQSIRIKRMQEPLPELEPAPDWAEIERAIGALVSKGVDPTYERAQDWLRHEAQAKAEQKRITESIERMGPFARRH